METLEKMPVKLESMPLKCDVIDEEIGFISEAPTDSPQQEEQMPIKLESIPLKCEVIDKETGFIPGTPTDPPQPDSEPCTGPRGSLPVPGKFMNFCQILDILTHAGEVLESVPKGKKDNAYFVVDNEENMLKKRKDLHAKYRDDCGLWDPTRSTTANSHVLLLENTLKTVMLRNRLFCKKENKEWIPMDPQPNKNDVIKIYRYYSALKSDVNYKRRITYLQGRGCDESKAVYEYCGVKSANDSTARDCKRPREQTTYPTGCKKKLNNLKYRLVKHVYESMVKEGFSGEGEVKMPYYKTYIPVGGEEIRMSSEISDEDKRTVLTMLAENASVQAVMNRENKPSCVILYSEEQLTDMKRNLEYENVIGLDCSYKLGDCFLTLTAYQNSRALHVDTNEPLLYLGPMFLHWDEEFSTYVSFFSHITEKLDFKTNFEVKLRPPFRMSLFKALEHSFPTSECLLNYHHMRETLTKELDDTYGGKAKNCSMIVKKIFGSNGLVSSPSGHVYQKRVSAITSSLDEYPKFQGYFGKLHQLLYTYACEPQQKGVSSKLWLNGNGDAIDWHLRSVLQQKSYTLPVLMEKLISVSKLQMLDLENTV